MPVDRPLGTFHNKRWAAYRLTTGRHYLLLPRAIHERLQITSRRAYWRYMARQLRHLGLRYRPAEAWRAFAD